MREFRSTNLDCLRRLPEALATALRHHADVAARPWMQKPNEQENALRDTRRSLSNIGRCGETVGQLETELRTELLGLPPARNEVAVLRAELGILRAWSRQAPLLAVCAATSAPKDREEKTLALLETLAGEAVTLKDQGALVALVENAADLFRSAFGPGAAETANATLLRVLPEGGARACLELRAEVAAGVLRLREDVDHALTALETGAAEAVVRSWEGTGSQAIPLKVKAAPGVMVPA